MQPPVTAEVREICGIADDAIRNLRITECYYRLARGMEERTGAWANWCSFATWASRQAGCSIRGEDLLVRLAERARPGWTLLHPAQSLWRALLRAGLFNPGTRLGRVVRAVHSPFDAFERAGAAVAQGNRKVFEEIGFEFARFLESDSLEEFLAALRDGPPPEGQELLRRAFTHYRLQACEPDPARKAQLTLLANLEIGLHEQTRLQPQIQTSLEVVPETAEDLARRMAEVLAPGSRAWVLVLRPFGWVAARYRRFARRLTRIAITEALMVLHLPGLRLALGRNLDAPVPEVFTRLSEPGLLELCARYEPAGCADCGARDWADLAERMHYILHLFRAFHLRPELRDPPFTAAQVERLMSGRIPDGDL